MTRRPLVLWHRWFGLIAALWLFVMAATGSILVFYKEIDKALNPQLFYTGLQGKVQPVAAWVAAARAHHPELIVTYVDLPNAPGETAYIGMSPPPGSPLENVSQQVYVDPVSAAVLGSRNYYAIDLSPPGLMNFLYRFHYSLQLGAGVEWLLGFVALAWLIDHVVSVWLSFPSAKRWRESFRIRRDVVGNKRVFDLHRAIGLWLFPVTATLAFSGVYFNLHDEFKAAVNAVSPLTNRTDEAAAALPSPVVAPALSFDAAAERAGASRIDGIAYNAAKGLYWLRIFDPRDIDMHGRRWMFVEAASGRILSDRHVTDGSAGDVVMAWQFPLHSGKAFGWPGRIAIFFAGIATCMFIVTGLMMWARKLRARRLHDSRHRSRPLAANGALQPAE